MPTIGGVKVTQSQADVFAVVESYAPISDHALVPLAQHAMGVHQSSSGIRTRRRELQQKGLIACVGSCKTGSGRSASLFEAV